MTIKEIYNTIAERLANSLKPYNKIVTLGSSNPRFDYEALSGIIEPYGLSIRFIGNEVSYYTSYIDKIDIKDDTLSIYTRNSIYQYKLLDSKDNEYKVVFELTNSEREYIEESIRGYL